MKENAIISCRKALQCQENNPNLLPRLEEGESLLLQLNISTELVLPPDRRGQVSPRGRLDCSYSTEVWETHLMSGCQIRTFKVI